MIASLPMYDRPETSAANDRLWEAIRTRLDFGPEALTRTGDVWDHWQSRDLLLSQTCGYPYRAKLSGQVELVCTPSYDIDCEEGHYFSVFVTRADDPRHRLKEFATARFAYNEPMSQSGWAAAQNHAAGLGFAFSNTVQSGAHVASARMVAEGRADIAALDAVSWTIMQRWDGFTDQLRVLGRTAPTPGLPLITAKERDPAPLRRAVSGAIASLSASDLKDLCLLVAPVIFDDAQYKAVPNPPFP